MRRSWTMQDPSRNARYRWMSHPSELVVLTDSRQMLLVRESEENVRFLSFQLFTLFFTSLGRTFGAEIPPHTFSLIDTSSN